LTGLIAVITAAVAVTSAVISARASSRAARTAQVTANMERFAEWQLHKREVYARFLSAAAPPEDMTFHQAMAAVMLTANSDTREYLRSLDLPAALADAAERADIEEHLVADVRKTGQAS
jgi:hypothetical protein